MEQIVPNLLYNNYTKDDKGRDHTKDKWVFNLSSIPFMGAQKLLLILVRGPNFAVVPKCPPKGEYVAAEEEVCLRLSPQICSGIKG